MLLADLQLDRNLRKKPSQDAATQGAPFSAVNPTRNPQNSSTIQKKQVQDPQQGYAREIITASVITACLIQSSANPSRVEIQGNDITLYDDTSTFNGKVSGDTSRLVFTHDLNSNEGFIMEKRASVYNTYDNVASFYALPAKTGAYNYMFFGRNAYSSDAERNTSAIVFGINQSSADPGGSQSLLNGSYFIEYSVDGVYEIGNLPFFTGNSSAISPGLPGFSAVISGGDGGFSGLGYKTSAGTTVLLYVINDSNVTVGASMIPDAAGVYDLGSPSFKFKNIYGSIVACPLPAIENALTVLDEIPDPVDVGDRGHFGDGLYYDDQTLPEVLSFINSEGNKDVEITKIVGFLLSTVKELSQKVKDLEKRLS